MQRFRQSVLAQAVSGKLTEGWRKENGGGEFNTADIEKKREEYQKTEALRRGQKSFKYQPSVKLDLGGKTKGIDKLPELPPSWQWVSLGQVTWSVSDGPHFSPNYLPEGEGVKLISGRNLHYDGIDFSTAKYISEEDYQEFINRGIPLKGDLLISKGGTTGIATIVDTDEKFSIWVHVALLKVVNEFASAHYLRDVITSPFGYHQTQVQTHGVGNQDLGLTRMIYFATPLPPLAEQQEIVRRVQSLFAVADRLEARYEALREKVEGLPQALLAKAFRGELVGR